jgi:hypothetical protein
MTNSSIYYKFDRKEIELFFSSFLMMAVLSNLLSFHSLGNPQTQMLFIIQFNLTIGK